MSVLSEVSEIDHQPTARDMATCLVCGRRYAGRPTKPRWAFAHDGHLVGSVHASHTQQPARDFPYWTAEGTLSLEAARYEVWRWNIFPRPVTGFRASDEGWAFTLAAGEPSV